jgi:hypothetical protein
VPFWYSLYEGQTEVVDEYGSFTGEYIDQYDEPVKDYANISPATGDTTSQFYGLKEAYEKIIALGNPDHPISETSRLWVENDPETGKPHDYIVVQARRGLDLVRYAVRKVDVSGE